LQWLQDPSKINGDNLNNITRKASRHFRNKRREYLKDKINELAKTVITRTLETSTEHYMNLTGVTILEIT
jgi:hypothetical protein